MQGLLIPADPGMLRAVEQLSVTVYPAAIITYFGIWVMSASTEPGGKGKDMSSAGFCCLSLGMKCSLEA